MKKGKFALAVLSTLLIIQTISANNHEKSNFSTDLTGFLGDIINDGISIITSVLGPIFGALIGAKPPYDQFFFVKILVFILLYIIISMSLKRSSVFGSNRAVTLTISVIVAILSVRFMGDNQFILGLLLPYGALGGSITILLPLLIYFLFVHTSVPGTFGRRAAWVVYGIIFGIIWYMQQGDIGGANAIYWFGLGFVILAILFDPTIHRYFNTWGLERITANQKARERRIVDREVADLQEDRRRGIVTGSQYNHDMKTLRERRNSLS